MTPPPGFTLAIGGPDIQYFNIIYFLYRFFDLGLIRLVMHLKGIRIKSLGLMRTPFSNQRPYNYLVLIHLRVFYLIVSRFFIGLPCSC